MPRLDLPLTLEFPEDAEVDDEALRVLRETLADGVQSMLTDMGFGALATDVNLTIERVETVETDKNDADFS